MKPTKEPGGPDAHEPEILASVAGGDHERATILALRAYGGPILAYLRGILRDDDAAQDAFSLFSLKLWKSLAQFRSESSLRTFVYRLAWFAALEQRRAESRTPTEHLATDQISKVVRQVWKTTISARKPDADDRWALVKDSLDPDERSLLLLRVEMELPWQEVVRVMSDEGAQVSEAALRKRFERLREKVRELAKEHGLR